MSELTYILGAGASYQSISVVKTFPQRFQVFIENLRVLLSEPGTTDIELKLKFVIDFLNELQAHSTFDTHFKKLFHSNNSVPTGSSKR